MATFCLKTIQKIPTDLETAWSFFSDADNLQAITPENLGFSILSDRHDAKMYPGQIIEYRTGIFLLMNNGLVHFGYGTTSTTSVQWKEASR